MRIRSLILGGALMSVAACSSLPTEPQRSGTASNRASTETSGGPSPRDAAHADMLGTPPG